MDPAVKICNFYLERKFLYLLLSRLGPHRTRRWLFDVNLMVDVFNGSLNGKEDQKHCKNISKSRFKYDKYEGTLYYKQRNKLSHDFLSHS